MQHQSEKDSRPRDDIHEILRKHGDISVRSLRRIYGLRFAWNHKDNEKLADALATMDVGSLDQLVKHHKDGTLLRRITKASTVL